jgi:hypothetical protein
MKIERQDKQPDPRAEEMQKNWRAWAQASGFTHTDSMLVEAGGLGVLLEVWASPTESLIYLPQLPRTRSEDVLYLTENLVDMLEIVKKLVLASLALVQMQPERREERARLN